MKNDSSFNMFLQLRTWVIYCQIQTHGSYMLDLWTIHSEHQHILQPSILYWVLNSMFHLYDTMRWTILLLFHFELLQKLFRLKHPDFNVLSNLSIHHRYIHLHGYLTFNLTSQVIHWSMSIVYNIYEISISLIQDVVNSHSNIHHTHIILWNHFGSHSEICYLYIWPWFN